MESLANVVQGVFLDFLFLLWQGDVTKLHDLMKDGALETPGLSSTRANAQVYPGADALEVLEDFSHETACKCSALQDVG